MITENIYVPNSLDLVYCKHIIEVWLDSLFAEIYYFCSSMADLLNL